MDRSEIRLLKEQRASVWEESKNLLNDAQDSEGWTSERDERWAKVEKELSDLDKTIERAEVDVKVDTRDAEVVEEREDRTGVKVEEYDEIFRNYLREGLSQMTPEHRNEMQKRALSVGTDSAGGYTVPEGFWNRVSEAMLAFGNVASVSNVITTATGNNLPWMTNDDTANKGAILAENNAVTEQDVVFGTKNLGAYLYTSKMIKVSTQLMQDSAIDIEGFLAKIMAKRLARIHNEHQTTGTGSAQPDGIVTGATTGKTTASATAITYDEILDLFHSVDPDYRAGNTHFMFNDSTLSYLRKVRDDSGGAGLGRPLWEPSVQVGEPSTIYGRPYVINQDMASIATTNTTVLFGDFSEGYVVRNVKGMQVVRLDERYAELLQTAWFAYDRQDSTKDNTAAYKALVQA